MSTAGVNSLNLIAADESQRLTEPLTAAVAAAAAADSRL